MISDKNQADNKIIIIAIIWVQILLSWSNVDRGRPGKDKHQFQGRIRIYDMPPPYYQPYVVHVWLQHTCRVQLYIIYKLKIVATYSVTPPPPSIVHIYWISHDGKQENIYCHLLFSDRIGEGELFLLYGYGILLNTRSTPTPLHPRPKWRIFQMSHLGAT